MSLSASPVTLSKLYMTHNTVRHARHDVDSWWWRTERISLLVRGKAKMSSRSDRGMESGFPD